MEWEWFAAQQIKTDQFVLSQNLYYRTTEVTKNNNVLTIAYTSQEIPGLSILILKPIDTVLISSTLPPGN